MKISPSLVAAGARSSQPYLLVPYPLSSLAGTTFARDISGARKEGPSKGVEERARSTADEFKQQAKEKAEAVAESAKETLEDAKEKLGMESQSSKEKFKEQVEKGKYDNIGDD